MEGGCADFCLKRILRRANEVMNATMSVCLEFNEGRSVGIPNMAVKGHGCKVIFLSQNDLSLNLYTVALTSVSKCNCINYLWSTL